MISSSTWTNNLKADLSANSLLSADWDGTNNNWQLVCDESGGNKRFVVSNNCSQYVADTSKH